MTWGLKPWVWMFLMSCAVVTLALAAVAALRGDYLIALGTAGGAPGVAFAAAHLRQQSRAAATRSDDTVAP